MYEGDTGRPIAQPRLAVDVARRADADLARAYRTQVDPRLNYEQALELAMMIAERSKKARKP